MKIQTLAVVAMLALAACTPRRIPGTEIDDTDETRALLGVMEKYRSAMEAKDPDAVMSLIDPSFRDNAGTATPEDDTDYKTLRDKLADRFSRLDTVKVDFDVKRIEVEKNDAQAVYSYTSSFRFSGQGQNQKPFGDSELEQMTFKRADGVWRITSGI
jgi:hypothetical protein